MTNGTMTNGAMTDEAMTDGAMTNGAMTDDQWWQVGSLAIGKSVAISCRLLSRLLGALALTTRICYSLFTAVFRTWHSKRRGANWRGSLVQVGRRCDGSASR
jgi:hypothetical protein